MLRVRFALFLALFPALLLSTGCSGMRLIESDVSAHSNFATVAAASGAYRFERLPSQQSQAQAQAALEQIVATALAKVGMAPAADLGPARFSVQSSARSGTWIRDDEDRLYPSTGAWGASRFSLGIGIGSPSRSFRFMMPITYLHRHEVSLILRDLNTAQIVYETRAFHEGPWADAQVLYGVMFDAALQGFPRPPASTRRIRSEIPR